MQPILKRIGMISALAILLAVVPIAAWADVAAENARMQQHIDKIIPAYHAAKTGDVMEPWVETETLRQLARGYAFLGDETRMQETLAQVPIIKQRGTLLYPYMDLMLARLQAEDVAGVFDLFNNIEKAVATVNAPARDLWKEAVEETKTTPDLQVIRDELRKVTLLSTSEPLKERDFQIRYCEIAAEHWSATERMDLLDRLAEEAACDVNSYKAAALVRIKKIVEAFELLKAIKRFMAGVNEDGEQISVEMPFHYPIGSDRFFDTCRVASASALQIEAISTAEGVPPATGLAILLDLEAYDAAYDYTMTHASELLQKPGAQKSLVTLYEHLFLSREDEKLQVLVDNSVLIENPENKGSLKSMQAYADYTGGPWWAGFRSPIKYVLSKRPDAFALKIIMQIKDERERFEALSEIYFFIPRSDKDSFPACRGNTRECIFREMLKTADAYMTGNAHAPYKWQSLMYAILAEMARVEGDSEKSRHLASKILDNPDWVIHPMDFKSYREAAQSTVHSLMKRAKIEESVISNFFPPKHDRPTRYEAFHNPAQKKEVVRPHKNPLLLKWVREADEDMRKLSWRYNMAGLYPRFPEHERHKKSERCLLDVRRLPPDGWPENQK